MEIKNKGKKKMIKSRVVCKIRPIINKQKKKKKKVNIPAVTAVRHLKHKNAALAKALTQQLKENKELRDDIVNLQSRNLHLTLACNRRDEALLKIEKQTKDNLVLLGNFANTAGCVITSCRQFTTQQIDMNQSARRSSPSKVASMKSCVVLPTVSGHTITKPTINLSRLNMQRVRNVQSPNLSVIEESSTRANTSVESNSESPTVNISSVTQRRKLPQRIHLLNMSTDDEDSRRRSDSLRLSQGRTKQTSRSSRRSSLFEHRLSNGTANERKSIFRSPRVQLKDVSKILQNSQTINVRQLSERLSNGSNKESNAEELEPRNSSSSSGQDSNQSFDSDNGNSGYHTTEAGNEEPQNNLQNSSMESFEDCSKNETRNDASSSFVDDDPLEGTSWKFENTLIGSNNQSMEKSKRSNDISNVYNVQNNIDDVDDDDEDETIKVDKFINYVNSQRGASTDIDDFTLLIRKHKPQTRKTANFSINDLTLPVLEPPLLNPAALVNEPDELTCAFENITQNMPTFAVQNAAFMHDMSNLTVRLPRLSDITTTFRKDASPLNTKSPLRKRKSVNPVLDKSVHNYDEENEVLQKKGTRRQKKHKISEKDPSTAKVVLKKLKNVQRNSLSLNSSNEEGSAISPVVRAKQSRKQRLKVIESDSDSEREEIVKKPTQKRNSSVKSIKSLDKTLTNSQPMHSSDSECSVESASVRRPKRKVAPTNLAEPSLNKKIRRPK